MKYIFSIFLNLIFASCFAQGAEIFFEQDFVKLPKINEGDPVGIYYSFTNTGDKALNIVNYTVPCVCTKVRFPLQPIEPGKQDSVFVSFDSIGKKGIQDRSIKIYSNAINSPTEIRFRLAVKPKRDN